MMSQFTERTLVSSQTSSGPSPSKARAEFTHYGFLVVDAWCAYGVHLDVLVKMRSKLVADSGPFLDSIKEAEQASNSCITYQDTRKLGETGFPRAGQRVLNTWPVNSFWSEFMIDLHISDAECSTAQDQVDLFVLQQGWGRVESPMPAFMSCLQLWYYGYPVEKVCLSFSDLSCFVIPARLEVFYRVQLKSIAKPSFAISIGRALMTDMLAFASRVRGYSNVTNGVLTPANRFLSDSSVPECCRYTVGADVLSHCPGASKSEMDANAAAKKAQAAKRARIQ
jgi:hypothetical protein